MSGSFTFAESHDGLESSILIEENVIWDGSDQATLTCIEDSEGSDTITEHYITAQEDENGTQYFSVLETSTDTILDDMSITVDSNVLDIEEVEALQMNADDQAVDTANVNGQEVLIYDVPGDGLYGIQIAADEDGNLQKYQFKLRQNEAGQLEAVTESIQMLSMENEHDTTPPQEPVSNEKPVLIVKRETVQEEVLPDVIHPTEDEDSLDQLHIHDQDHSIPYNENGDEEIIDVKTGILESALVPRKQELNDDDTVEDAKLKSYDNHSNQYGMRIADNNCAVPNAVNNTYEKEKSNFSQEPTVTREETVQSTNSVQETTNTDEDSEDLDEQPYEQVFLTEDHVEEVPVETQQLTTSNYHIEVPDGDENSKGSYIESDNDDYEIVEGLHVTGDMEASDEELVQMESADTLSFGSYQKTLSDSTISKDHKTMKNVIHRTVLKQFAENYDNGCNKLGGYYIVQYPEKENVVSNHTFVRFQKSNPRSILKSSFQMVPESYEEQIDKRFAKSKEAVQARMFHNYINQTTILHAPVRQERLPRKQTIKPVKRQDEEIVVEEVMVSSNGFVEPAGGLHRAGDPLKPDETYNISDSDDEYNPRKSQKRRKKQKRRKSKIEIVISDSEDDVSETSVIEIDASDASCEEEAALKDQDEVPPKRGRGRPRKIQNTDNTEIPKRKRGRPPKNPKSEEESEDELEQIRKEVESHLKETRTCAIDKQDGINSQSYKQEIKCIKCPKKFSSQGSLRTHMQYHSFSESTVKITKPVENTNKYACKHCSQTFKNTILLTNHIKAHENLGCNVCKKIFPDKLRLSAHKRVHLKEHMFRTTNAPEMSPKRASMSKTFKSPPKSVHKCITCGVIFTTAEKLQAHAKIHKKFMCSGCSKPFTSRLLLDAHIRSSCVKNKSPVKARKSSLNKEAIDVTKQPHSQGTSVQSVKCDQCTMTFATYTTLFKHKVAKHGLETPDKTVLQPKKKTLYKERQVHGGVPANKRMVAAYASLRNKLYQN